MPPRLTIHVNTISPGKSEHAECGESSPDSVIPKPSPDWQSMLTDQDILSVLIENTTSFPVWLSTTLSFKERHEGRKAMQATCVQLSGVCKAWQFALHYYKIRAVISLQTSIEPYYHPNVKAIIMMQQRVRRRINQIKDAALWFDRHQLAQQSRAEQSPPGELFVLGKAGPLRRAKQKRARRRAAISAGSLPESARPPTRCLHGGSSAPAAMTLVCSPGMEPSFDFGFVIT